MRLAPWRGSASVANIHDIQGNMIDGGPSPEIFRY